MKKLILIILALLVLGTAAGAAWWRYSRRENPMAQAQAMLQTGDLRGAALQLRAAVRTMPNDPQAHLRLGTVLLQLGDPVAGEKELRAAKALGATSPDLSVLLAQSALAQGHNKELLVEFQPPMSTPDLTAQLLMVRALAAASLDDANAALQALQLAERLSPTTASVPLTAARIALTQGNLTLAATEVEHALQIDPRRADGLLLRGQILRTRGNRAGALAALDQSLVLAPHFAAARLERANLLLELGEDSKANIDVADVLKSQPNSAAAIYLNAVLLTRARENAKADEVFQRLSNVMDRFPRAYFFQALVKLNLNQLEQARDYAQRFVARSPTDPDGVKLLARVHMALKRPDLAIEVIGRASQAGIADPEMFDLLTQAYTAAGKPGDASLSQSRALALSTQISPQANSSNAASLGQNLARLSNNKPTDLASLTSNSGALDETTATPSYSSQAGAEVVAALVAGEVDKAAIALARMRVEEGSSESVGLLNAALMAMRQEYNGARKQFEALIVANPDSLRPRIGLAQLLMQTGETSQAEQVLGEILAKDPSNETSLTSVLPVLLSTGRTERAVRLLENAAKAAPDNKKIGITLASLYLQAGMADKALVQIDLVIGKAEATSVQLRLRGLTLVTLRRLPEAIEAYSQLQRKSPGDVTVVRELLGLHLNAKNYLAARDVVQVALRTQPNNIELLRLLIATDLAEGGEAAALASLDKMRAVPTTELAARELRADFDMFRHRFLDAAEAYSQTYKIAPTSVLALKSAQAFMQAGQVIAASDMLKTWLATMPNDTNALRMLSDINMSANQFDAAGELLERLVAQQPDDILALNNLAYIYSLQKSPKAVPMARRAYIMRPSPETAETLGWSLVQAGDAPAGLPLIAQAAVALPADPSVQYHYAVSLKQVGKTREALEVAQKLGDQNTGFADQDKLRVLVQELRNAP